MEKVFYPFKKVMVVFCTHGLETYVSRVSSKQEIGKGLEFRVGDFLKCLVKIQII